ncbi:MAG: putative lipid II flippase FtsW [Bacilli bacterium]
MKSDKVLSFSSIILSIFGLIMIYSSSYIWAEYKYNNPFKYVISQGIFLIIGIILMIITSKIDYKIYKKKANTILGICLLLLMLVLIPGIGALRNGSRSWISLGPIGFQPSEIAKIGLIIFSSKFLSNNDKNKKTSKNFFLPVLGVIFIFFILIMLEPDFGTAMVIVMSLLGLIFITGSSLSIFIKLGIVGLCGIVSLVAVAPYRIARILSFLNPWSDPLGSGFQIIQSLYAIGPGGILGQGFLSSRQTHFYLPEPQTDFIFSIICEEFGFLGVIIVSSLFIIIFYRAIKISLKQTDLFAKYLSFGLIFMLIFQTLLNLSVVVGLIPVTGVTLPFISYGGSSLLISFISIGIILNISKH